MIHARSISNPPNLSSRAAVLIHATGRPATEELEEGATWSAKDGADENLLLVPLSNIAIVPEFWLTSLITD
jgi:hypothetical protein